MLTATEDADVTEICSMCKSWRKFYIVLNHNTSIASVGNTQKLCRIIIKQSKCQHLSLYQFQHALSVMSEKMTKLQVARLGLRGNVHSQVSQLTSA